jgi:hypothetical protein
MKFPKYWKSAKNSTGLVVAHGWSNLSEAEAAQRAEERLQRILKWLRSSRKEDLDRYHYVIDDSICEPVVDQILDGAGHEIAVISRNAYGALVLNAATVMIVDIDVDSAIPRPGFIARIFGAKPPSVESVLHHKLDGVRDWQRANSQYTIRIYRTAAGLRLIFTSQVFDQVDSAVISIMDQLQSDPLYRDLCISQQCFRARLTPKPWRIGLLPPVQKFPFLSEAQEKAFYKWYSSYTTAANAWAVCEMLESIGEASAHPVAWQIVELHDSLCCRPGLKLA